MRLRFQTQFFHFTGFVTLGKSLNLSDLLVGLKAAETLS